MNNKINILIIDDHPFFLEGLKMGLESIPNNRYAIDTSSSPVKSLDTLKHNDHYDLILCDLNLPEINGITFMQQLLKHDIWIPVAIISASENPSDIQQSMNEGAAGFLNKSLGKTQLNEAIESILAGIEYLPPSYLKLCRNVKSTASIEESIASKYGITHKQFQVLSYMGQGLSNKEISERMGVAISTIKSHTKALFQILNVNNRTACILAATKLKILNEAFLVEEPTICVSAYAR